MSIIKILSENLVNQIAAGEVVERPSSVIKELVENSIDAGSDKILIEVTNGGKSFIKIADNGAGISKDDIALALTRHATSKIIEEADLWNIHTMGFRGEALASIASVSKLKLKSRSAETISGFEIISNGGDVSDLSEVAMDKGTIIEISDLFFNTPARQKYLKQDSTELSHITSLINNIALAHPNISFKLIHNGKVVTDLPKTTDLISRISDVFGSGMTDNMLPIFYGGSSFQIDGFIGKPLVSRSSSQHQYFFVNGRCIQHFLLANTIKSAYHSMLMENKKPIFVINIKIDPSLIDVNVHPRKLEIRFSDQQGIIRVIYGAVKTALDKAVLIPKGFSESQRYMSDKFPDSTSSFGDIQKKDSSFEKFRPAVYPTTPGFWAGTGASNFDQKPSQDILDFTDAFSDSREHRKIQPILQISNSYIIAQNSEGLILIDQHAAHERVRFEELMGHYESQKKSTQPLLVALQLELSRDEYINLEENMHVFDALGFEIEQFGGNTFVINSVPACLVNEDIDVVIKGVLDDIINQKSPSKFQGKVEEILTYMSCRSAIKFGQKLNMPEMESLVDQMDVLERKYTCPHGRPTMVSLTLDELHKMFGRK